MSTPSVAEDSPHFYPYVEKELLGAGAYGAVFKAYSLERKQICVAKHMVC